jgi:hypothetical protein
MLEYPRHRRSDTYNMLCEYQTYPGNAIRRRNNGYDPESNMFFRRIY